VGLAAILHMSAMAFQIIKFLGVAYLLYLAWSMWKESVAVQLKSQNQQVEALGIVIKGFLINILNPKLSLFFLAFLPQFIPVDTASAVQSMLLLSGIFMAMTLFVFILYGLFANSVRVYVAGSPRIMRMTQRSFALMFAMLGAKLALTER
jgi:threonine/homoserine/homoserine lactone efflux protein